LVGANGRVIGDASAPVGIRYPQPAWVEQDPVAIWESVKSAVDRCLAGYSNQQLAAIAITNQRESALLWERATGVPLGPCIMRQCRRTAPFCQELAAQGLEPMLRQRTGLPLDPLFSASKMRWLLEQIPEGKARAVEGELCLGTVDSWLLWHLTGGTLHACDISNASRTQLFNLHTRNWDPELLAIFDIPAAALPAIYPSSAHYGTTVAESGLPAGIPIAALIGDSHAALYGHAGFKAGAIKATYGTGSSLMTTISTPIISNLGFSTTVAWATQENVVYALESQLAVTGAAVAWLCQLLNLELGALELLAARVEDSGGVYLVPAFEGLGALPCREETYGLITGLTGGTSAAHLARATLESIAYQVRDLFDAMQQEVGQPFQVLLADGGASRNRTLMQFQADMLGTPLLRSAAPHVSALGAAYLAGLAIGMWADEAEIAALPRAQERFDPKLDEASRATGYAGWQRALAQTILPLMTNDYS
jgi:glycerol kinase